MSEAVLKEKITLVMEDKAEISFQSNVPEKELLNDHLDELFYVRLGFKGRFASDVGNESLNLNIEEGKILLSILKSCIDQETVPNVITVENSSVKVVVQGYESYGKQKIHIEFMSEDEAVESYGELSLREVKKLYDLLNGVIELV